MHKRDIGNLWEQIAATYLTDQWYTIVETNFTVYGGEIDIIAKNGDMYIFVEVRFRKNATYAHPLETLSRKKLHALRRAVYWYITKHHISEECCRIDCIGILPSTEKDGAKYRLFHIRGVEFD